MGIAIGVGINALSYAYVIIHNYLAGIDGGFGPGLEAMGLWKLLVPAAEGTVLGGLSALPEDTNVGLKPEDRTTCRRSYENWLVKKGPPFEVGRYGDWLAENGKEAYTEAFEGRFRKEILEPRAARKKEFLEQKVANECERIMNC